MTEDEVKKEVPRVERKRWGYEHIIIEAPGYRAKIIVILPGRSIHLQSHHKKHESMYILEGQGYFTSDEGIQGKFIVLNPGEMVVIPPETFHKVWSINKPKNQLKIIEVSNGIGDDDVMHLEEESYWNKKK